MSRGPDTYTCERQLAFAAKRALYAEARARGLDHIGAAIAAGYSPSSASRLERWRLHDLKLGSKS